MSGPSQTPEHLPRTGGYIDPTEPRWSSLHPSPYLELSHQYQSQQHGSSVLTPVSIADSPYIQPRPSSGVSHFSQEYPYLDDNVVSQGLGVSSSYQEYAPVPTSPPNYNYPQHQQQHPPAADFYNYGSSNVPSLFTLEPSIPKQTKRQMTSNTLSSQRNSPVRILPHPEGMQRLEHERRGGQMVDLSTPEPSKTRPPGRGRRDPQAEEEDIYVENLRAQNLSWKTVAEMFRERYGKNTSEARLQMRMLRRRKSAAAWHEADIPLLHEAHRYWRTAKFGIIAKKLQDLGASQEYSEDQIQSQLKRPRDDESEYELEMTSPEIENRELRSSRTRARTTRKRKRRLNAEQEDHGGEGEED